MPSVGVIKGEQFRLYLGGSVVAYATECSIDLTAAEVEIVHKDNAGASWRNVQLGQKSGTVNVSALFSEDGAANTHDVLFNALANGTSLTAMCSTEVAGDNRYNMTLVCTSFSVNATVNENASFSATFAIDGEPTIEVVT